MYNLMEHFRKIAGVIRKTTGIATLALVINPTTDGLVQIVHAADAKCTPSAEATVKREVSLARAKVPKDNSYAATRGKDGRKERGWVTLAEYNLTQFLRDYCYKQ